MKRIFIIGVLSVIILSNCSEDDNSINTVQLHDFGPLINLREPDTIPIETNLYDVQGITFYNDYVFVSDNYDTIIRVFKYPEFKYIGGPVLKGRGPYEIQGPRLSGFYSTKEGVTIHGLGGRVFLLDIKEEKIIYKRIVKLPGSLFNINYLFDLGGSIYYATNFNIPHEGEFVSYNLSNKKISTFSKYPKFLLGIDEITAARYALGLITIKRDYSKFARSYIRFPALRIYDKNGSELSLVWIQNPKGIRTINETYPNEDNIIYIFGGKIYSTDKYIYVEYKILEQYDYIIDNQILVYDWEGYPKYRFSLYGYRQKRMNPYFVSEDNHFLYMVSDTALNEIYRYNLDF